MHVTIETIINYGIYLGCEYIQRSACPLNVMTEKISPLTGKYLVNDISLKNLKR